MTKTLRTAAIAALLVGGVSGMALADCGAAPKAPAMPADGGKATGKEMEALSKEVDTYGQAFQKFNECIINEYKGSMDGWEKVLADYQAKNKKK